MNRITLIGNLGGKPELKKTENGAQYARFTVATNENYKDKNGETVVQTEWHNVVIWGEQAERAERQLNKGTQVFVEGKMTAKKYTDKDGVEKNYAEVKALMFRAIERNNQAEVANTTQMEAADAPF